jgi:hypothetical protein
VSLRRDVQFQSKTTKPHALPLISEEGQAQSGAGHVHNHAEAVQSPAATTISQLVPYVVAKRGSIPCGGGMSCQALRKFGDISLRIWPLAA